MDQKKEEQKMENPKEEEEESIPDLDQVIFENTPQENTKECKDTIKQHINTIMDQHKITKHYEIINKQITNSFTYKDLYNFLLNIYCKRKKCYKINMGIGFILYNIIEKQYKYHYVSHNHMLFDIAKTVSKRKDINKLIKKIISKDIATTMYMLRPDSQWSVAGLVNLQTQIFNLDAILG